MQDDSLDRGDRGEIHALFLSVRSVLALYRRRLQTHSFALTKVAFVAVHHEVSRTNRRHGKNEINLKM